MDGVDVDTVANEGKCFPWPL